MKICGDGVMKLTKEELIIYSVHLLNEDSRPDREYDKDHLSNALGISPNTLDLYLTRLKNQKLVERIKKKYVHDLRRTVILTEEGQEVVRQIGRNLECLLLTEQRHNIPSCMELTKVMAQLPDPLEKVFFLSLYNESKYFDLPMFLNSLRLSKDEMSLLNVFCELDPNSCGPNKESFVESFFNASLYGNIDPTILRSEVWPKENINSLITLAQAKIRMGRFEDAKMIHDYILNSRRDLSHNQWFIAKVGCVQWYLKKGDLDNADNLSNEVLDSIENKVMQSYLRMLKGYIIFHMDRRDEAMDLLKSSISSFTTFGLPLFLSIAHNTRGVCYFMSESYIDAERDWIKARRYAREARSEYSEAKILPNLADIAMKNKKYELSRSYLDKSAELFLKYNDYEGVSDVEFNLALLCVELEDIEGLIYHFKRSKEVAFPFPSPFRLKVFRDEILKRCNEKGLKNIDMKI